MLPEVRGSRERPLVLVVDDDTPARFILTSVLRESGFDVAEAADGAEGVDRAAALLPDLVIMDVVMPKMDGFAACAALRALPAGGNIPVLMLTGLEDVAAFHRSFDAGASDFATKPISPAMLSHRVRFMLRASTALSELRSSETRLAEAQRIAKLGHWECDLALERFRGSPEVNATLGLEPGVTVGCDALLARVHPDYRDGLRQAFQNLIRGEEPLDHQDRLSEEGRGPRFIHVRGELVRDHGGTPVGLRGTLQDITDRVRAEEQIRLLAYHDSLTGLPNHHLFATN